MQICPIAELMNIASIMSLRTSRRQPQPLGQAHSNSFALKPNPWLSALGLWISLSFAWWSSSYYLLYSFHFVTHLTLLSRLPLSLPPQHTPNFNFHSDYISDYFPKNRHSLSLSVVQPACSFKEMNQLAPWQFTKIELHCQLSLLTHVLPCFWL